MSVIIDWEKLVQDNTAEWLKDMINSRIKVMECPKFIENLEIKELNLGSVPPQVEILDISDPWEVFYEQEKIDGHEGRLSRENEDDEMNRKDPDVQTVFRINYNGDMKIVSKLNLKVNKPIPSFIDLSLTLIISQIRLNALVAIAYTKEEDIKNECNTDIPTSVSNGTETGASDAADVNTGSSIAATSMPTPTLTPKNGQTCVNDQFDIPISQLDLLQGTNRVINNSKQCFRNVHFSILSKDFEQFYTTANHSRKLSTSPPSTPLTNNSSNNYNFHQASTPAASFIESLRVDSIVGEKNDFPSNSSPPPFLDPDYQGICGGGFADHETGAATESGDTYTVKVAAAAAAASSSQPILKNVDKLEAFVEKLIRELIERELVYPNYWTILC